MRVHLHVPPILRDVFVKTMSLFLFWGTVLAVLAALAFFGAFLALLLALAGQTGGLEH